MGIPEYEAKRYEGRIKDGSILLSVHADDSIANKFSCLRGPRFTLAGILPRALYGLLLRHVCLLSEIHCNCRSLILRAHAILGEAGVRQA